MNYFPSRGTAFLLTRILVILERKFLKISAADEIWNTIFIKHTFFIPFFKFWDRCEISDINVNFEIIVTFLDPCEVLFCFVLFYFTVLCHFWDLNLLLVTFVWFLRPLFVVCDLCLFFDTFFMFLRPWFSFLRPLFVFDRFDSDSLPYNTLYFSH